MTDKTADFSRRDFLKTAGAVGLGSLLSPIDNLAHSQGLSAENESKLKSIPTRPFGKTGVTVSILGLGGAFTQSNLLLLKQAVKMGVTYWDTAEMYGGGNSEAAIGKYFAKFPEDRKKVFLATKAYMYISDDGLEQSLKKLNTEYIDLYLYHAVGSASDLTYGPIRETVDKMKKEGKIRFFGFSTHKNMENCLMEAASFGWIDAVMMTYNYRLMHTDRMKVAVEACANAGIGLTAMKTQAAKASWGPVGEETPSAVNLIEKFTQNGFTAEQAKLKAVWDSPHISCICSHMPNMRILSANAAAAMDRTNLSDKDKNRLKKYAKETESHYCAGCAQICESTINDEVPISDVMRYLMYARSYGESDRARTLFKELPSRVRKRMINLDYSSAELKCPQRMQIGRLMHEAVMEFA